MVAEVPCQGAQGGLLLGKVALQFSAQCLQLFEVGFDILREDVFQPLTHPLGQNRRLPIGADGQFQRAICDDASHVKITAVGNVGDVEQMAHQTPKPLGPPHLSRFDGGHDAHVVATHIPRPSPPARNGPHIGVFVNQRLHRFGECGCKHANCRVGAAFEQEVKLFFGDFRSSEDVEGEVFRLEEDGELRIHG